jgi:hypothetical protein
MTVAATTSTSPRAATSGIPFENGTSPLSEIFEITLSDSNTQARGAFRFSSGFGPGQKKLLAVNVETFQQEENRRDWIAQALKTLGILPSESLQTLVAAYATPAPVVKPMPVVNLGETLSEKTKKNITYQMLGCYQKPTVRHGTLDVKCARVMAVILCIPKEYSCSFNLQFHAPNLSTFHWITYKPINGYLGHSASLLSSHPSSDTEEFRNTTNPSPKPLDLTHTFPSDDSIPNARTEDIIFQGISQPDYTISATTPQFHFRTVRVVHFYSVKVAPEDLEALTNKTATVFTQNFHLLAQHILDTLGRKAI